MKAKIIHTEITTGGVIHVVDQELPPGSADIIILFPEAKPFAAHPTAKQLPLGGYKAGWIPAEKLRREAMYDDEE